MPQHSAQPEKYIQQVLLTIQFIETSKLEKVLIYHAGTGKIAFIVVIGGSIPMLFVLYTTAPFVNLIYLKLPHAARQTRQRTQFYLKDVPQNATLDIETMKLNFYFRSTQVALSDLVLGRSTFRPVNLINTKPGHQSWWKGNNIYFYAPVKTRLNSKPTSKYFPEVWEGVFAKIKENTLSGAS
ncbi:conserved hypothetical protein [Histoplasma capsulatum var. duboisii H88]|uniref:Uncharacterized protein n=2 Tax=Ajellomyces capsulatus TaxID=5037 RepID=F0U4I7_AJEC8|nr:conserved hypothetical protein [Histoplasma capsulatum H143]EGC41144.1 conserved hypothetical protein [Histoplasma capsulatum var. duboisii H88]